MKRQILVITFPQEVGNYKRVNASTYYILQFTNKNSCTAPFFYIFKMKRRFKCMLTIKSYDKHIFPYSKWKRWFKDFNSKYKTVLKPSFTPKRYLTISYEKFINVEFDNNNNNNMVINLLSIDTKTVQYLWLIDGQHVKWGSTKSFRGVFRTQSNNYKGDFSLK